MVVIFLTTREITGKINLVNNYLETDCLFGNLNLEKFDVICNFLIQTSCLNFYKSKYDINVLKV